MIKGFPEHPKPSNDKGYKSPHLSKIFIISLKYTIFKINGIFNKFPNKYSKDMWGVSSPLLLKNEGFALDM